MIDEFLATLKRQQWPPLGWALAVACLLLLFTHFGFYHWLIKAGLLFAVFWIRPNREFLGWYLINTLCSVANAYKNLLLRDQDALPFLGLWPSAELFLLGTMALPLLAFTGVQLLKRNGIRTDNANTYPVIDAQVVAMNVGASLPGFTAVAAASVGNNVAIGATLAVNSRPGRTEIGITLE